MEPRNNSKIVITNDDLTISELVAVSRENAFVEIGDDIKDAVHASRAAVDEMVASKQVVYGITTGFGSFSDRVISPEETTELQHNLIESHACGVGKPLPVDVVRAMILLRVKSLTQGYSGIRLSTIEKLIELLNKGVTPVVPEKGSLGSSGDLCPLSHMVLPILGKGEAYFNGERLDGETAMARAGIEIISLEAKEGLALNNGTQCMTAVAALAVFDALHLLESAEMAAALTFEALNGRDDAFDPKIHKLRRQNGQEESARRMLEHTSNSTFLSRPEKGQEHIRVQDAYSLRCIAQVHGASRDAINYVVEAIKREMNAVTDNPLIFINPEYMGNDTPQVEAISGGNFHGQPVALAMDFLAIAVSELANISERRMERLLNDRLSNGLPSYLMAERGGLHSGFMIVQYSAAALVSENKVLSHPASVDSIPSSNNHEDHVSMGTIAARKAAEIIENVCNVIAMEMLSAAQAVDLRLIKSDWTGTHDKPKWLGETPSNLGDGTGKLYNEVRRRVSPMMRDRVIAPDIAATAEIIKSGVLTDELVRQRIC